MIKFRPGDLVRINDSTHQDDMPDHRVGMILAEEDHYEGDVYSVLMLGTDTPLRFHRMFLAPFTTR
ncbi:MAG: hypothetical protein CMF96_12460 [Candidatus Marinimicrobia bacterium]|nr:hypothetical protein [Candidatus Neomarinimicrobiota bacterium]OUV96647.1 MAG: hypothetical protein CBD02_04660 [Candidatus Pelagibacter sp. TMED142]